MKRYKALLEVLFCCICALMLSSCTSKQVERKQYGSICGIPIYSESSNTLIIGIQEELLNGGHPIGAYEDETGVKFIYE